MSHRNRNSHRGREEESSIDIYLQADDLHLLAVRAICRLVRLLLRRPLMTRSFWVRAVSLSAYRYIIEARSSSSRLFRSGCLQINKDIKLSLGQVGI